VDGRDKPGHDNDGWKAAESFFGTKFAIMLSDSMGLLFALRPSE
jgi:hypothetical protein